MVGDGVAVVPAAPLVVAVVGATILILAVAWAVRPLMVTETPSEKEPVAGPSVRTVEGWVVLDSDPALVPQAKVAPEEELTGDWVPN